MKKKIHKAPNFERNYPFISMRKAHSRNMLSYTNKDEKAKSPALSIGTLRSLASIVRIIRARIEGEHGKNGGSDEGE